MVNTNFYSIELRDKAGKLKMYLTAHASDVSWKWNRLGGCGRCTIKLQKEYRSIRFSGFDDIQIRVRSGSTSKLVYRGWVASATSSLGFPQTISLDVRGYFDLLDYRVVHVAGLTKTYTNMTASAIVEDIIDTFVTPSSSIAKGTINDTSFTIDTIDFKCSVSEALKTLAEIEGEIEYGVDANLNFYFIKEGSTLQHKFFVGNNVSIFDRKVEWDKLLNKIYFEGGEVNSTPFTKVASADDSQDRHFLSEDFVDNSSIKTDSVAIRYLLNKLKEKAKIPITIKAKIVNTDKRLEDTLPVGLVAIYDPDYDQTMNKWGTTANGGSNLVWGTQKNGGSGAIWGGVYKEQVDSIKYTLSQTEERFNIELTFGNSLLDTAAKLKRIELMLSSLRQK